MGWSVPQDRVHRLGAVEDPIEVGLEGVEVREPVAAARIADLVDEPRVPVDRQQVAARLAPDEERGDREVLARSAVDDLVRPGQLYGGVGHGAHSRDSRAGAANARRGEARRRPLPNGHWLPGACPVPGTKRTAVRVWPGRWAAAAIGGEEFGMGAGKGAPVRGGHVRCQVIETEV